MSIASVIAGAYTGTWNSVALNYTRRGFNLNFRQMEERIEETDLYGRSFIDAIYQGGGVTVDTICRVWGVGPAAALWPWTGSMGEIYNSTFPIAQNARSVAKALILTGVANTPATTDTAQSTAQINTFTASLTMIAPEQLQVVLNSQGREAPLRFDLLVSDSAGTGTLFAIS